MEIRRRPELAFVDGRRAGRTEKVDIFQERQLGLGYRAPSNAEKGGRYRVRSPSAPRDFDKR